MIGANNVGCQHGIDFSLLKEDLVMQSNKV